MGINQMILIGTVANEPIVETEYADGVLMSFDVRTVYPAAGRPPEEFKSDLHRIHVVRTMAKIAADLCRPGATVFVEGKLRYRQVATGPAVVVLCNRLFRIDSEHDLHKLFDNDCYRKPPTKEPELPALLK